MLHELDYAVRFVVQLFEPYGNDQWCIKREFFRRPCRSGGSICFKIRLFFTQRLQLVGELSMLWQEHYKLKQHAERFLNPNSD